MQKEALIAANFIGFFHFLWDDIDMLNQMGYKIYAIGDNEKKEDYTLKIMAEKNVTFIDAKIDAKSPFTKNNIVYYSKVKDLLKEHHFDVIHCHTPIVGLLVRCAARKYRKQGTVVIYTTHGLAFTHLSSKKEYFIYFFYLSKITLFLTPVLSPLPIFSLSFLYDTNTTHILPMFNYVHVIEKGGNREVVQINLGLVFLQIQSE